MVHLPTETNSKGLTGRTSLNVFARRFRILSIIKSFLVPSGKKNRVIKFGLFKGLKMRLDLRSQTQVYLGLWERETYSYMRTFTRQAKTCIDIGAAEGEYSLFFLSQANVKRVIAFDPSESSEVGLTDNLVLNGFDEHRLEQIKKFVAVQEDNEHCTLDSFANLEGPCVVKIDVDGGESLVLQGAHKLMERRDVSWVIETHSAELEQECIQILNSRGLTTRIIKNAWWRILIPEQRPIPHNRWVAAWHA